MIQPPTVVCAGILVADLFVPPLERLPAGGDLVVTEDFLVQPGGCAANTAISLAKLGVSVSVVGKVGTDVFGEAVETGFAEQWCENRRIMSLIHSWHFKDRYFAGRW